MEFKLLKLKLNGIKNIYNDMLLEFNNNENFKNNIKAIYGPNGSGKSALIDAVKIYKDLVLNPNYISINNENEYFNNVINQNLNQLDISVMFAVIVNKEICFIYEHSIKLKKNKEEYIIYYESLYEIVNINELAAEHKLIFKVENGMISTCNNLVINDSKDFYYQSALHTLKHQHIYDKSFVNALYFTTHFILEIYVYDESKSLIDYKENLESVIKFIQVFNANLKCIDLIDKDDEYNYIFVYKDGRRIKLENESTGMKRLFNLYYILLIADEGGIVFVDDFDKNIHEVLLMKLIDYLVQYSHGQIVITLNNITPMQILEEIYQAINIITHDTKLITCNKNKYKVASLYRKGLIEGTPFNIESFDFLGIFGTEK